MPMAGRPRPLQRQRGWWSPPPTGRLIAGFLAAAALTGPTWPVAFCADGDPSAADSPGWEFVPLGPEGADFVSVTPLEGDFWLGLSGRGQLFCWIPFDSSASGGAWQRVPLGGDGAVHQVARVAGGRDGERVLVLLTDGTLLTWAPPSGGSPRARWGELRRWAAVPAERALSVVSALPGDGAPQGPEVLLAMRDGAFWGVRAEGTLERWRARFLPPATQQDSRSAGESPAIRIRWAGRAPGEPGLILAITEWEGLFASRDGAQSFSPVMDDLPKGVRSIGIMPGGGLCAACVEGVFTCREPGARWQALPGRCAGGEIDCREICALLADPRSPEHLLARTARGRILRSLDGGQSWRAALEDHPVRVRSMAYGLDGRELLLATSRGVLASCDGGASWQWRNRGLRQAAVQAIAIGRDGEGGDDLFIGTDLGFYFRSGESGAWRGDIDCTPGGEGLDPATWQRLSGRIFALDLREDDSGYRRLGLGTEAGPAVAGWQRLGGGCGWAAGGPQQAASTVMIQDGGGFWAAGRTAEGFWAARRDPSGAWASVEMPAAAGTALDPAGPLPALVRRPDAGGERILMASCGLADLGAAQAHDGADEAGEASVDGKPRGPVPGPPGCCVLSTACGHGTWWAATDDGLWRTRDATRWERVAFGGERTGRVTLAAGRPGLVVCRTSGGVVLSANDGASWRVVPVPEQLHVMELAVDQPGSRLYLGTQMGLFAVAMPGLDDPIAGGSLLEEFRPLDAQPNPFSTHVVLRGPLGPIRGEPARQSEGGEGSSESGTAATTGDGPPAAILASDTPSLADCRDCELLVVNVHGQVVRRVAPRGVPDADGSGRCAEWTWDGRDERGQVVPKGIYLVSARVGSVGYRGKVIKLR